MMRHWYGLPEEIVNVLKLDTVDELEVFKVKLEGLQS